MSVIVTVFTSVSVLTTVVGTTLVFQRKTVNIMHIVRVNISVVIYLCHSFGHGVNNSDRWHILAMLNAKIRDIMMRMKSNMRVFVFA